MTRWSSEKIDELLDLARDLVVDHDPVPDDVVQRVAHDFGCTQELVDAVLTLMRTLVIEGERRYPFWHELTALFGAGAFRWDEAAKLALYRYGHNISLMHRGALAAGRVVPSYKTMVRKYHAQVSALESAVARGGIKDVRYRKAPYVRRNPVGLGAPYGRWEIDEFHLALRFFHEGQALEASLLLVIAVSSRYIVGWSLLPWTAQSTDALSVIADAITPWPEVHGLQLHRGPPELIVADNGGCFASHAIEDRLYAIVRFAHTGAHEPHMRAHVERNGGSIQRFIQTTTVAAWANATDKAGQSLVHVPPAALPTFQELRIRVAASIYYYNHVHEHAGLGRQVGRSITPARAHHEGTLAMHDKLPSVPSDEEIDRLHPLEPTVRVVEKNNIEFNRKFWFCPFKIDSGTRVRIRVGQDMLHLGVFSEADFYYGRAVLVTDDNYKYKQWAESFREDIFAEHLERSMRLRLELRHDAALQVLTAEHSAIFDSVDQTMYLDREQLEADEAESRDSAKSKKPKQRRRTSEPDEATSVDDSHLLEFEQRFGHPRDS